MFDGLLSSSIYHKNDQNLEIRREINYFWMIWGTLNGTCARTLF